MKKINKCTIKTSSGRDYYTVGTLGYYWESIIKNLGDIVELIDSESVGIKYKRLVYNVEVKDIEKFEERIKRPVFDNWVVIDRNYEIETIKKKEKRLKQEAKVKKLRLELEEAEKKLQLF